MTLDQRTRRDLVASRHCGFAIPRFGSIGFPDFALVIDGRPEVLADTVDLYENLIHVPPPVARLHCFHTPLSDFRGELRPERCHQNRTVSWQMSTPRSYGRCTAHSRRMTSGLVLKSLHGERFVIGKAREGDIAIQGSSYNSTNRASRAQSRNFWQPLTNA